MITISKFEYEYLTNHAASVEEIADKKVAAVEAWIEALKASEKEILMETKIAQRQLKESKLEQELEVYTKEKMLSRRVSSKYAYTLKVDEKNDVYSFGVVLLELLTGRRPVGNFGEEGLDIVQWTKLQTNWSNDKVVKILDERLCHIPLDEAKQVYFVAMLCVQEQSVERPTMREVVEMLAQAKKPNTFQKQ
ncbi:hypothetical protein JHK82_052523 [Glycine max]|nr:hypothetical protein JHK84_052409 [Glycine max]KAG5085126.1 hypothetical protein JHK82_052523 [Glycine max]